MPYTSCPMPYALDSRGGTELAYAATLSLRHTRYIAMVCCYALATRCPVLSWGALHYQESGWTVCSYCSLGLSPTSLHPIFLRHPTLYLPTPSYALSPTPTSCLPTPLLRPARY
eukprot:1263073-Rhodomonas_salina.1